jgi:heme-degrading monooxygenase HmoA
MYARSTTIQGDPKRIDEGIRRVRDEVMPTLTQMDGSVGLSMIVDRESGRSITTSAWRDQDAMRTSDAQVRPLRDRAGEAFGGQPEVNVWEIAVLHRAEETGPGACVRATWIRVDASRLQDLIDSFRMTSLPSIEALPGFRSTSLFVDRESGRAVTTTTYDSRESLNATRDRADELRTKDAKVNGMEVLEVAEFDLELAHLRVPETV